nr:hypothetical protein [Tanacetum cinerariifolium]
MIEEPVKPKKKDQIRLGEEAAKKLQAEFNEEERLAREMAEKEERDNIALIETKDDIQAKIDADHQLAKRLQAQEEEEELFDAEKATLFQQLLKKEESTLQLKEHKRKETNHQQNEEEEAIDAIPLAIKSPRILDWKIHKEGKKNNYQIVRANGKSQMYMIFSQMLKSFNREDLEDLYKLVKARYGLTRPVESMHYLLYSDIQTMFKPHVEDEVWKMQQGYKVLEWKLYDSC